MDSGDSGDFDDSNYFEASRDGGGAGGRAVENQPFDEALDVSASMDHSYGGPREAKGTGGSGGRPGRPMANAPYDEALDVSASMDHKSLGPGDGDVSNNPFDEMHEASGSDESIDTTASAKVANDGRGGAKATAGAKAPAKEGSVASRAASSVGAAMSALGRTLSPKTKLSSADSEESDEASDAGEGSGVVYKNAYKAADFAHLNVNAEVRELFNYIERYKPHEMELDTTLMCFIPDYIPAVGDMDAFLKVPRPDGKADDLGLKVLDEPSATQSDPTVLELQLRAISKKVYGDVSVRAIENAHKSPQDIDRWINSIQELHRNKPPPRVSYSRSMPDIEPLMEAWPEDFERALGQIAIPPASEMDVSLEEYVRVVCAVLNIPVYDNPVESLHVMFTLYSAFKNNPHFIALQQKQLEQANAAVGAAAAAAAKQGGRTGSARRRAGVETSSQGDQTPDYKADHK